jgi:maleamate amidohydrolase
MRGQPKRRGVEGVPDSTQLAHYRALGIGVSEVGIGDHPAMLVVDFQRLFTEGVWATTRTRDVLHSTATLLYVARRAGVPVIYARVAYDRSEEVGVAWLAKSPRMAECLRGSPAWEFHPAIAPCPDDLIIEKKRASAFFGTNLHEELQSLGIDTVILAGTSTSGCVRATAVDAAQLDYRVTVVEDCVDDRSAASNSASLTDVQAKYGDVLLVSQVLQHLPNEVVA